MGFGQKLRGRICFDEFPEKLGQRLTLTEGRGKVKCDLRKGLSEMSDTLGDRVSDASSKKEVGQDANSLVSGFNKLLNLLGQIR